MKRSEMLKVIKNALHCHLPGYSECPDFIAETVLQSIEAEGIIPPGYTCIHPDLPEPTPIGSCMLHKWEPE